MKKSFKLLLLITIIFAISLTAYACDGTDPTNPDITGLYDMDTDTDDYEYRYVEVMADGTWQYVYCLSGGQPVVMTGTYSFDSAGNAAFTGNDVADDLAVILSEGSAPSISYEGKSYALQESAAAALSAPVIAISNDTISWSEITNSDMYLIYDGNTLFTIITATSINLSEFDRFQSETQYSITVKAKNAEGNFLTSASSNSIQYSFTITPLAAPQNVYTSGAHLYWDGVTGAEGYIVYKNGAFWESFKDYNSVHYSYPFSIGTPGTYTITIKAIGNGVTTSDSPVASVSYTYTLDEFNTWEATELSAPTITLTDGVISWNAVNGAESYNLYADNFLLYTNITSPYTVDIFYAGEYQLAVMAIGDICDYTNSTLSNAVTYTELTTGDALSAPVIVLSDDIYLSWGEVPGADKYAIMEGTTLLDTTEITSYTLSDISDAGFTPESVHNITVIAQNDDTAISDSPASNIIVYTVPPLAPLYQPTGLYQGSSGYIFWNGDADYTTHYIIYVGEEAGSETEYARLDMSTLSLFGVCEISYQITGLTAGEYSVYVVAHDNNGNYGDSLPSSAITFTLY